MNFELENKVALVTGGSKNIGKEIALSLASEKVNIAFTYNSSENQAEETLSEIKKFGVKVKAYKLDISKFNETQDVLQKIYKDFGNIDILINNAGFTKIKKFVETNIDDWNKQIDISLKGTIYCCHLVSKKMIDNQDGRIINIDNLNRIKNVLKNQKVEFGGKISSDRLYVEPTIIIDPDMNSEIMNEEIFGPILPVLSYENESEIKDIEREITLFHSNVVKEILNNNKMPRLADAVFEFIENYIIHKLKKH